MLHFAYAFYSWEGFSWHPDLTGFLLFSAVTYGTFNSMLATYEMGLKP